MAINIPTFDNDYSFLNLPGQIQEVVDPTTLNEYISNTNLPSNVNANTIEPLITYNQPTPISSQEIFQNNLGGGSLQPKYRGFIPYGPNNPEPPPPPPTLYRGKPIDRGIDPNAYNPSADPTNSQYNPEAYDANGIPIPGYMPYEGYTPIDDIPSFKTDMSANGFRVLVPINRINYETPVTKPQSFVDYAGGPVPLDPNQFRTDEPMPIDQIPTIPSLPSFNPIEGDPMPVSPAIDETPTPEELTFNFDDPNAPNYTPIFTGLPDFDTKGTGAYNAMANMKYLGSGIDLPKTGDIVEGYRYMGGDVGQMDSWEKYDPNKIYAPIGSSGGTAGYSMFGDGGEVNEIQILLKKLR